MKKQILGVAGAVALALSAGTASAMSIGTISTGDSNQGVSPIYGFNEVNGWYGAQLYLFAGPGGANISVTYLGSEAGYRNSFTFGAGPALTTAGNTNSFSIPGAPNQVFLNVASGLLNFSFTSGGGEGTVVNGANPDNSAPGAGVNYFIRFADCATITGPTTCGGGQIADLWLDDFGAGDDDNHDDMVIRLKIEGGSISVVPIPAALPLLLSGLAGLGFVARRRKVA